MAGSNSRIISPSVALPRKGNDMRASTRILTTMVGVVAGTALVIGQGQGYKMTVSQDRLVNAASASREMPVTARPVRVFATAMK